MGTTQRPHQYNLSRSTSSSISPPTAPSNSGQFRFEWNNKSNPNKKSTKQNNENRNNNKQFGGFGGGASSNSSYQFGTNGNARSGSNDLSHSNTMQTNHYSNKSRSNSTDYSDDDLVQNHHSKPTKQKKIISELALEQICNIQIIQILRP